MAVPVPFKVQVNDLFSGYRACHDGFPCYSGGFEIEAKLNSHEAIHKLPITEIPTRYSARREGSASKLNKVRDGPHILTYISSLTRFLLAYLSLIGGFRHAIDRRRPSLGLHDRPSLSRPKH